MSNRIDRNASTRTFGPQEEVSPQRAKSRRSQGDTLQVDTMDRPALSRTATPIPTENIQDASKLYESGLFADPPKQKAWGFGAGLFTDAHKHLVNMLRGECVRLHLYSRQTKAKLTLTERQLKLTQEQVADLKSVSHHRAERLVELSAELREAQESLAEMDAMLSETRKKRQNRLSGIAPGTNIVLGEYAS